MFSDKKIIAYVHGSALKTLGILFQYCIVLHNTIYHIKRRILGEVLKKREINLFSFKLCKLNFVLVLVCCASLNRQRVYII